MGYEEIKERVLRDDTVVVDPGPVLDNQNAHEMVKIISTGEKKGYKYVIIDMARLEFLSSAGVGSILGTVQSFRERGGDIVLCNVSDHIRHILEVLDLADYLTIRSDEKEAAAMCGITY